MVVLAELKRGPFFGMAPKTHACAEAPLQRWDQVHGKLMKTVRAPRPFSFGH